MITGTRIGRVVDREQAVTNIAVIGKLKCGEKVMGGNGKEYARSLDHFKATGSYASYFNDAFPEPTNIIPIIFITDDVAFSCPERYELRDSKGKLFGRSNGSVYEIWSRDKGEYVTINQAEMPDVKQISAKKADSRKGWERVLTLRFVIPKIRGIMGVWEFSTKADKASIDNIVGTFDLTQQQAGTVQRILFDLKVEKVTSQKPDEASTYPIFRLIPNMSEQNMMKLNTYLQDGGTIKGIPMLTDEVMEERLLLENKPAPEPEEQEAKPDTNIEVADFTVEEIVTDLDNLMNKNTEDNNE